MPLLFYLDQAKSTPIRTILATQAGNATTISCSVQPDEVIALYTAKPYSRRLTYVTSSPRQYQWSYSNGTVTIGQNTATSKDKIVCLSGGQYIFEAVSTLAGKNYFVANFDDANHRTKVHMIYLHNTETEKKYVDITVSSELLLSGAISNDAITFSLDGSNYQPSVYIQEIQPKSYVAVYVKVVVPKQDISENLRNVQVKAEGFELSVL